MKFLKTIWYSTCTICRPNKSRTVRLAFPLVFAATIMFAAVSLVYEQETYIVVESSQSAVRSGDEFEIHVYAASHVPVNAVDISLSFPKSQVRVDGIDTGESVITLWTTEPYVEDNTVILRGGTFRNGFLGKHLIATINATAIDTGLALIDVEDALLLEGDGEGSEVDISDVGLDTAKLYIANENGEFAPTFTSSEGSANTIEGTVSIKIITDIDGDGDVSLTDVSQFMAAWRNKSILYDFNGDGRMTFTDFAIILADSFFK